MSDSTFIDLSRVEAILMEDDYHGPVLSRVERLLVEYVKKAGKLAFDGPYDSVDDLPNPGEDGRIYLVSTEESEDYYDEYYYNAAAGGYVPMGTSEIQLQNYATKAELQEDLATINRALSALDTAVSTEISARQALDTRLSAAVAALDTAKTDLTNIASVEETSTASKPYTKDSRLIQNGVLYKAITDIALSDTLVVGVNIMPTTLDDIIAALESQGSTTETEINTLSDDLSAEVTARQQLDEKLSEAIVNNTTFQQDGENIKLGLN